MGGKPQQEKLCCTFRVIVLFAEKKTTKMTNKRYTALECQYLVTEIFKWSYQHCDYTGFNDPLKVDTVGNQGIDIKCLYWGTLHLQHVVVQLIGYRLSIGLD